MKPEAILREMLAQWLCMTFPDMIYRFDLAADIKLTMGQAIRHKAIHPKRGYPDLFIAEMRQKGGKTYGGLYLELKADGKSPYRKDGTLKKDNHLQEQAEILKALRGKGYMADFAVGFEEARQKIADYMGLPTISAKP